MKRREVVKVKASIHNLFARSLHSWRERGERSFPSCYLLGKNKQNIISQAEKLQTDEHGCYDMPEFDPSKMAKASLNLIRKHTIPCGIIRISNKLSLSATDTHRGPSLRELGRKGVFIISLTRKELKIHLCKKGRMCELPYAVVN